MNAHRISPEIQDVSPHHIPVGLFLGVVALSSVILGKMDQTAGLEASADATQSAFEMLHVTTANPELEDFYDDTRAVEDFVITIPSSGSSIKVPKLSAEENDTSDTINMRSFVLELPVSVPPETVQPIAPNKPEKPVKTSEEKLQPIAKELTVHEGIAPTEPTKMTFYNGATGEIITYTNLFPTDGTFAGKVDIGGNLVDRYDVFPEVGVTNGSMDGGYWTQMALPNTLPLEKVEGTQDGAFVYTVTHNSNKLENNLPGKKYEQVHAKDFIVMDTASGSQYVYEVYATGINEKGDGKFTEENKNLYTPAAREIRAYTCVPNEITGENPELSNNISGRMVGAYKKSDGEVTGYIKSLRTQSDKK